MRQKRTQLTFEQPEFELLGAIYVDFFQLICNWPSIFLGFISGIQTATDLKLFRSMVGNLWMQKVNLMHDMPFHISNLSICDFGYPWVSWNQSLCDMEKHCS